MHRESRAIKKMCGIETELGVNKKDEKSVEEGTRDFIKDIKPEWIKTNFPTPVWDPRERLARRDERDETHAYLRDHDWAETSNRLLPNGSRFYLDCNHPEISGPIAEDPKMLVVWNRACYRWVDLIRKKYREENGEEYAVFRNNVGIMEISRTAKNPAAMSRHSFACHLNMTVARFVNERELIQKTLPWFILQLPISGAGKVGADENSPYADFQISQRADFFHRCAGAETTHNRPWVNLRDAPYADPSRFRRFHMIPFDSNMLELPEYLKAGLTAILLMMIEDGALDNRFELVDPLETAPRISRDIELRSLVQLANREKPRLVVDCLRDYHDVFAAYLEEYHPENAILKDVVRRFDEVLTLLATRDWPMLFGKLDWVTKKLFIEWSLARKQKTWSDWLAYRLDTDYHSNNHDAGLFYQKIASFPALMSYPDIVRIATDAEILDAMPVPPPTRSRWVTETIRRYQTSVRYSDYWYCVTFADAERNKMISLYIPNPDTPWNEPDARELFALPLQEFLTRAEERGIAATEISPRFATDAEPPPAISPDAASGSSPPPPDTKPVQTIWNTLWNRFNKIL